MYNLHLTPEQIEIRDTVRDFVTREIKPAALKPERLDVRTQSSDVLGENRHLIHIACTYGQTACVKVLLDAGADVNEPGGWSDSEPLENAAWAGFPETVKLLVEHGADVNAAGQYGWTALHAAAYQGLNDVIEYGSLCGLGNSAPNPVLSTLNYFREEYEEHVKEKFCRAGRCQGLGVFRIQPEHCILCGLCKSACAADAVVELRDRFFIDQDYCTKCKACQSVCPTNAIAVERRRTSYVPAGE